MHYLMKVSPPAISVPSFDENTSLLWGLSVAFYGVGDLLTTSLAVVWGPLTEGSPLVAVAIEFHGLAGLVVLKLVVFAVAYALWRVVNRPQNIGVPLAMSTLGITFTTWNMVVIGYTLAG